jgi:hypothetical protein
MGRAADVDANRPSEEGYVVESVLEEFGDGRVDKHVADKMPSAALILESWPIMLSLSSGCMEWNDKAKLRGGSKANACNAISRRFNVDRKKIAS